MQYVGEHEKLGVPCCSRSKSSPGKSKKKRAPVSPRAKKNSFLFQVRLLAVLYLNMLFGKVFRSRGREEVVAIAVMPQFSKGDIINILIV